MIEASERWRVQVGTPSIKADDILVSFTSQPVRIAPSVTAQGGKLPAGTKEYRLLAVKVREPARDGREYAVMESRDGAPWTVLRWCGKAWEAVDWFHHICPDKPGSIYQSSMGLSARRYAERQRVRDREIETGAVRARVAAETVAILERERVAAEREQAIERAKAAADGVMVSVIAATKEAEQAEREAKDEMGQE